MKKFATAALVPLFAGFLWAQSDQPAAQETQTTTTTTTYDGTLVDAACRTTHTEHSSSSTSNPDANTTKTETSHSTTDKVDCPVTTSTTSFGLMTPEGQYVRFDDPSNTKIVEMVKSNKKWNKFVSDSEPLKVRVVGKPQGDVVVLETIR
jgi:hypothetical protein